MLPCQRAQFDVPRDVCYLNAAAWSPLPLRTQEIARAGVARKGQPWKLAATFANDQHERARRAAARFLNADPTDIALISSVGYGVAIAGKVLTIPRGSRVITLENDHTSPVLEWHSRAEAQGFTIDVVAQPRDGDWTSAVLAAVDRAGAPPVGLVSISSVHWSDGGAVDVARVAKAAKAHGAALLIDATHAAGVMSLDVKEIDPDFVIFPTYKWLLGSYGRAFVYVAKRHQDGIPLEQTSFGRRSVKAEQEVYFADTRYLPDARRFDMGERDHFISMEMASVGMEMLHEIGVPAVRERLAMLTERIAEGVRGLPVEIPSARLRAPHILSLGFKGGMPADLIERLASDQVYVAPRLGRMRISPHIYNDEADVDRFVSAMRRRLG